MMATGPDTLTTLRLVDTNHTLAGHGDNTLLIHIDAGSLTYSILDGISNTVMAYCAQPLQANEPLGEAVALLKEEEWLRERFKQVLIVVQPAEYVLVPKDLFEPGEVATYLRFHGFREPSGSVLFDRMDELNMVGVYHLPYRELDSITRLFNNSQVLATPTPFIGLATREHKVAKGDHLLVLFTPNKMHLVGIQQGRFLFYNSFEVTTKEDVSYYALAVCEQLHLSPEKVLVNAWGEGEVFMEQLGTLQYYFSNVSQGVRPLALKYSEAINPLPVFSQYPLFAASLCE